LEEVIEKQAGIEDCTYLARSELVASLDRLLYELYTGDSSHRPLRLNQWPYIDPQMFNVMTLTFDISRWPFTQVDHHPYFVQIAAIRYHYGISASNARQFLLSAFITPFHYQSLYAGCLSSVQRIIQTIMVPEVHIFLKTGLTQLILKESRGASTPSSLLSLKAAKDAIHAWIPDNPLAFRYVSISLP
jgi:hypothetical protein